MSTATTSDQARASIAPCAAHLRARVLTYITSQGNRGATCDEAEAALGLSHQTTSARLRELAIASSVMDLGERRPTRSGRSAVVWFSTEPRQ